MCDCGAVPGGENGGCGGSGCGGRQIEDVPVTENWIDSRGAFDRSTEREKKRRKRRRESRTCLHEDCWRGRAIDYRHSCTSEFFSLSLNPRKGKGKSPAKTDRYSWASTSLSARPCSLRRRSARRTVWLSFSGCSRATRHRRLLLVSPPSPP